MRYDGCTVPDPRIRWLRMYENHQNWHMKYLLIGIALLLATGASSQREKFRPGTLITATGDTLRGQISFKKDAGPDDGVSFRKNEDQDIRVFSWNQLKTVQDTRGNLLVKVVSVKRFLEYIDEGDYTIRLKDSTAEGPVPLRPLYIGRKLSLYSLYDKAPFYFLYDGKEFRQLVQRYRYLTAEERMFDYERGRRFHITDQYKGVLAAYYPFTEDRKMMYILENTLYEDQSFKTLVARMDREL